MSFWVSLPTSRATPAIHTLGPPTPHFWPKLSAVSQSRAAWVIEGLRTLFRSQPTGVGSGEGRQHPVMQSFENRCILNLNRARIAPVIRSS